LRVRGYTPAVFAILAPHVTTLPAPSAINVNTASPEVLLLVAPGWSLAEARALAAARGRQPFVDPAQLRARMPPSAGAVDMDLVRTTSEYFAIEAQVRYGVANVFVEASIHRAAPWPRVVRQSIGG
jgi:general secretion pathway protein K